MHAAMIFVGVFFVAVAVMVLVGIAGLVLLIVGLVTRRKALWGSGIAAVLLSFIAGGVTIGLGVRYMILSASEAVFSSVAVSDSSFFVSVSDEEMRNWFSDNADVELPDEVVLLNGLSHTILPTSTYYMKISAPEEFGTFLEEHFSTDTWPGVEAHFNLSRLDEEEKASLPFWNLSEIKQCSFFFQVSSGIA